MYDCRQDPVILYQKTGQQRLLFWSLGLTCNNPVPEDLWHLVFF